MLQGYVGKILETNHFGENASEIFFSRGGTVAPVAGACCPWWFWEGWVDMHALVLVGWILRGLLCQVFVDSQGMLDSRHLLQGVF